MGLPVVAPFSPAWDRMITVLFRPFDIGRWFILGFGAFLAGLGEGGMGNFRTFSSGGSKGKEPTLGDFFLNAHAWITSHWSWIILGAAVLVPILIAVGGTFLWLSSRGHFIFLDNLLKNRAELDRPWKEFRKEANSLFRWRFATALVGGLLLWLPMIAGSWMLLDTFAKAHEITLDFLTIGFGMAAWFAVVFLLVVPVTLVLRDFAPVIQWHRRISAGKAFKVFWDEVLPGNFWSLNFYYLWMLVLGMGAMLVIFVGVCCTCCIGGLPYLSSVLFLPVLALFRLYPAYYLAQLGKDWELVEEKPKTGTPAGQTYTLSGVMQEPPSSSPHETSADGQS